MKKFLKWGLIVVLVLVVAAGGFAAFISMSGLPSYEAKKIELKVEATPERIAHGRELALSLCVMCHKNPNTGVLSGTQMLDLPPAFGKAFSKNITQHPTKGIGKWTDGDIAWLLRTGIHPHTGTYVPPWMIKVPHMADEDLYSIIAWLRSDDPLLAANPADNVPSEPTFLAKMLARVVFKPFDYPSAAIPYPDTTNTVAYGKYLATAVYDCYGCHLADFADMNASEPEQSKGYCGGGNEVTDVVGRVVYSSNITPDKTGIGSMTRSEFIQELSTGIRKDGTPLRYPMVRMQRLSDHALGSLYDYLRTIPPINHVVERKPLSTGPWKSQGEKLFDTYACSSCHGMSGKGHANLLAADFKYPSDSVLADVINNQTMYNPDGFMPRFAGVIPDNDLATLVQYVRQLCKKKSS